MAALRRMQLFNSHRPVDVIDHWSKNGELLLNPPYQRGDVWGNIRRRNLIKSILQGIPIPSIIINDRFGAETWPEDEYSMAVIDGKQRITAILLFLESQLTVPGEWFGVTRKHVLYEDLEISQQRRFKHIPLAFSEGKLESLEDEQHVFELVNYGGVPQGESDI